MAKYYQLYMVLLTVVVISQSACVIQFRPGQLPGQIPRQIIPRQVITGQDLEEERQELFLIDEGGTAVDGTRHGTGSLLQLFPIPLLTLAVPMVAMAMMTMMSTVNSGTTVTSGTTVAPTNVPVTVPTTQAAVQTTPCVPITNCPEGYVLLDDQTASANCYFHSEQNGAVTKTWASALSKCTMTPGAYIWRPNSNAESLAVFNKFKFKLNTNIWTGANSPGHDGNYVFAIDNGAFSYANVPFGETFPFANNDCISIQILSTNTLKWDDEPCKAEYQYICEFPRKTCP